MRANYVGANTWVREDSGGMTPVMVGGKLQKFPEAVKFWNAKINKAWKRRDKFNLGHTEVE